MSSGAPQGLMTGLSVASITRKLMSFVKRETRLMMMALHCRFDLKRFLRMISTSSVTHNTTKLSSSSAHVCTYIHAHRGVNARMRNAEKRNNRDKRSLPHPRPDRLVDSYCVCVRARVNE